MALLKITQTWSLCTSVSFSVCTPPLRPQVTKHCFWHLSYPTRFHKSYWTGNTQSLKIYFFCGRHCNALLVLFKNLDQTRTISALVTSGFGVGTPIVFKDRLLIYATVNHQTISLSYVVMIGFAAERRETYFSAKQKWGGRERWGDGRRHFNDEILAASILEYFAHYLPNTFLMKYWQAAFIFSLWYRDLFRKGGELKKWLYNLDIMVCGVCIRDGHADAANAEWCG